jgi:calpain-15
MFSFLGSCGFCSNVPRSGDYAYEVFNKVPTVGGIFGNISTLFKKAGSIQTAIGGLSPPFGQQPGQIDSNKFVNNLPSNCLRADSSTFRDLASNPANAVIKKVLKSNYAELVKEHAETGQKFTDPDFPPDKSSLGAIEDLNMRATWKRIPDIIRNAEFVSERIEPNDILQGSIGDCYFLSALSAIAENDFRIKNLFPCLEVSKHGVYMARVLHRGVLTEVVVDDYVPVNEQGEPLFAKPAGGREIWVMLLEKCWAKVNGSYGSIVGGLPNEVLHAFTGSPTYLHDIPRAPEQQNELWGTMWEAYSKGAILCCGTKGEEAVEKYGFVKGHAYTIVRIVLCS